jgi:dipeptidyl-peptidase III
VNSHLAVASEFADTKLRKDFLEQYRTSFQNGDLANHKESQKLWVKDKQPPVETYFGFVETYRDLLGTRAEFEGFVAIPDVEDSKRLRKLVNDAQKYIATLPWVAGAETVMVM